MGMAKDVKVAGLQTFGKLETVTYDAHTGYYKVEDQPLKTSVLKTVLDSLLVDHVDKRDTT